MTAPKPTFQPWTCHCTCGCKKPAYGINSTICTTCRLAKAEGDRLHEDPEEGWI